MINCTLYHSVNGFQHMNQHGYVGVINYNFLKILMFNLQNMQATFGIVVNIKAISTGSA